MGTETHLRSERVATPGVCCFNQVLSPTAVAPTTTTVAGFPPPDTDSAATTTAALVGSLEPFSPSKVGRYHLLQ